MEWIGLTTLEPNYRDPVYGRLRRIAGALLRRQRAGHTLQTTALIHEGYLKLARVGRAFTNEEHFYSTCARAMKQALIDYNRRHRSAYRVYGEASVVALRDALQEAGGEIELTVDVRSALARLRRLDETAAETVRLRHMEGMTIEEVSRHQGRLPWQVREDEDFALDWMARRVSR